MNKYGKLLHIFCLVMVTVIITVSFSGCAQIKLNKIMEGLSEEDMDCPAYDLEKYTQYYWDSPVIYNEAVFPLEEEDGTMKPIPLMYEAAKILAVRNSSLDTLYEEGKDYLLEDGKLVIPHGSAIKTVAYSTYYPSEGERTTEKAGGGYIMPGGLQPLQLAVTYVHVDEWEGTVPAAQGSALPKTLAKLENKEPIKILIYGDSISTGAESTSHIDIAPYADTWMTMFEKCLKDRYGYDDIEIINTAVGGTDSSWGFLNAGVNGKDHEPDLAIIAFGMNDMATDPATFCDNICNIATNISFGNPDCEFIMVSTMLPNPESAHFYGTQIGFRDAMKNYNFSFAGNSVVADMTTLYEDMLANKRYWDMSSNNINHPNDFLARAYAMLMLRTLETE